MTEIQFSCPNLTHKQSCDLAECADYDDFLQYVKGVSGSTDYFITSAPETLLRFVNASKLSQDAWDNYIDLDESDRKTVEAWCSNGSSTPDWGEIRDSFVGVYDTAEDCAREVFPMDGIPENLRGYIDFEYYARDLKIELNIVDYEGEVYVFSY